MRATGSTSGPTDERGMPVRSQFARQPIAASPSPGIGSQSPSSPQDARRGPSSADAGQHKTAGQQGCPSTAAGRQSRGESSPCTTTSDARIPSTSRWTPPASTPTARTSPGPRAEFSRNRWTRQEVLDWFAGLAPQPRGRADRGTGTVSTATATRTAPRPADAGSLARGVLARITCKGGPQLLRAALAAGVVGELDLTIAPTLAGSGIRLVGDALLPELVRLRLTQVSRRRASCSPAAHLRRLIAGTAMTAIRPAGALPA